MRFHLLPMLLALPAVSGCGLLGLSEKDDPAAEPGAWKPLSLTHLHLELEELGPVPSNDLLPPTASPDGNWVAYLKIPPGPRPPFTSLFTGQGLERVALAVRAAQPGASERVVCPAGAAWPAWSPDGRHVAYAVAETERSCHLAVHDVAAGTTRRLPVRRAWIVRPVLSPDGRTAAVGVCTGPAWDGRLHAVDLATGDLSPAPRPAGLRWQFPVQWRDRKEAVLLQRGRDAAFCQWRPGSTAGQRLARTSTPAEQLDAVRAFAGVNLPLSPDRGRLAHYDPNAGRLTVVDLAGGGATPLPPGTRSGCWFGADYFLAATETALILVYVRTGESRRLLRGRWLPLWADERSRQALACTASDEPGALQLVRLRFRTAR